MLVLASLSFVAAALVAPLASGDTVAVVGASGNVGKLVALRLADSFKVRGIVRAPAVNRVRGWFGDRVTLHAAELNDPAALTAALEGVNAVVLCMGTTAFPTKAWAAPSGGVLPLQVLKALVDAQGSVPAAIDLLDQQGVNTPRAVDERGTRAVLAAWAASGAERKRLVMMSSIGVARKGSMPFPILNACGVLDAKAAAEAAVKAEAAAAGFSYSIVRPGQLLGGPYDNNYYLGTLFQLDADAATRDVKLAAGDTLLGDSLRSTVAEVIATLLESGLSPPDFSVINAEGEPPSAEALRARLAAL